MTDLSPAALAVWHAYEIADCDPYLIDPRQAGVAAALRAAADQRIELEVPFLVVDEWEEVKGSCARFYAAAEWGRAQALQELLAIADELEGQ